MVKKFDPKEWLMDEKKPSIQRAMPAINSIDGDFGVIIDRLVIEVEREQVDITQGYEHWRNIAFALAHTLGESGRGYFHRISCINPNYNKEKCDKQYSSSLRSNGSGITLGTLLWIAKTYGVIIKREKNEE